MTTASTHTSLKGRFRTYALAGTLALSAMIPSVPATMASGDDVVITPTPTVSTGEQFDITGADGLIGLTAKVNAEGDGVNLRATADHDADVVRSVPDGTIVSLRVDVLDTVYDPDGVTRWWPVSVDGQDGWISGFFLTDADAPGEVSTDKDSDGTAGPAPVDTSPTRVPYDYTGSMTAMISADGEGLVLRSEPDRNSAKVTSLKDGTIVELRIDVLDTVYDAEGARWWPVAVNGYEGWVSGFYLVDPDAPARDVPAPSETTPDVIFQPGDTVSVVTESGRGLVVRVDPAPGADRLASLQEGQNVQIVSGPASFENSVNGWYLISTGEVTGYVDGDLLVLVSAAPAPTAPTTPAEDVDDEFAVGDFAEIRTPTREGVNLRAGSNAESDQTGFAPNQALVEILSGPTSNGWYEVRWDRQTGFIDGSLLVPAEPPQSARVAPADETEPVTTQATADAAVFTAGDYAAIDAGADVGVNVREAPGSTAERTGFLDEGAVVRITDGPESDADGNDWYRVTDGEQSGWVRADLMVPTDAPAEPSEASADEDVPAPTEEPADEAPAEQPDTGGFILPLNDFRLTQDFGCSSLGFYTYDPTFGCAVHDGIDLAAPSGTPLYAAGAGTVVAAGWCDCGLGYYVEIDHGNGLHTVYGHMASQPIVSVGQSVGQGDVIGPVGSTGLSTGPHVHFMVRQDGVAQDPKNYLPPLS